MASIKPIPARLPKSKTAVMPLRGLILAALLLNACGPIVPATTPPQLQHTPGAFVTVTEARFDAGLFQVDYPKSWRVVKTSIAADRLLQVVFAAPQGSAVTLTQADVPSDDDAPEQFIRLDNGIIIRAQIQPAADPDAVFATAAQKLIASIRPQ